MLDGLSTIWGYVSKYLCYRIAGVPLCSIGASFLILALAFYLKGVISRTVVGSLRKITSHTRFALAGLLVEAMSTPVSWGVLVAGIYFAVLPLGLSEDRRVVVGRLISSAVAFLVMVVFLRFVDGFAEYLRPKVALTRTSLDDAVIPALKTASKITVVLMTIIWVLNNLQYPVTSILAGLGVGGLAVALAAQGTLSNWFGAFMIFSDRPFTAGDRVVIDNYDGFIEQVGLRSTRIRTLEGTLVSIPNSTVANAHIDNLSRRDARKSNYMIGVTYNTPAEKVEEALSIIKGILDANEQVREDHIVRFEAFADFSLSIRVIYWALTLDYAEWLSVVEAVNLEILRKFNAAGIEFAFPTQTVYVKRSDGA